MTEEIRESRNVDHPDWHFDTNEDLRSHARELVSDFAGRLLELDNEAERPEGTIAHAFLSVPCHDDNNVTRQLLYLGYCAEACQDVGLVARSAIVAEDDTGETVARVLVCTADGLTRALIEQSAEDHPERSSRSH